MKIKKRTKKKPDDLTFIGRILGDRPKTKLGIILLALVEVCRQVIVTFC